MGWRRLPPLALVLVAAVAAPALSVPTATPVACPPGVPASAAARVDCGLVNVPLRYDVPAPEIQIAYARLRAGRPGAADATLLLGGGPGEKVVRSIGAVSRPGALGLLLARTRDLILIDQRGVGRSIPALECPIGRIRPGQTLADLFVQCGARLRSEGNDLSAYNTLNDVRDLDQVRQALGYPQLNLFGSSYGARLALEALRGEPPWIRSVALSSAIPAEANFVADAASSFSAALARTYALCRASRGCNAQNPGLARTLDRTMRRLAARPAVVRVGAGRSTRSVTVTAAQVSLALFSAFYSPQSIAQVPRVITAMGRGDFRPLVGEAGGDAAALPESDLSNGMQLSFLCQEEAAYGPASLAANARRLPRVARELVRVSPLVGQPLLTVCAGWGVPKADPLTFAPVSSAVPALVFTGQLDQITPPRYGAAVARQLPNSTLIPVPFVGHSPAVAAGACGIGIISRFFDDPAVAPRTACVGRLG
jgi:pimeloyl-ACP methyl ester carboxylesterase